MAKKLSGVLTYHYKKRRQSTVRRYYEELRTEQGIPERCDNLECRFYTAPLTWNGKRLRPVLDHKNGRNDDSSPENLRFLCPNCHSQLPTSGGKNTHRVRAEDESSYHQRLADHGGEEYKRFDVLRLGELYNIEVRRAGGAVEPVPIEPAAGQGQPGKPPKKRRRSR